MSMKLGFNMAGTEDKFEEMLALAKSADYHYLEIGVADCATLLAVAEWMNKNATGFWNCLGLDVEDGPYFSADRLIKRAKCPVCIYRGERSYRGYFGTACGIDVSLHTAKEFLEGDPLIKFEFCLIDGCHGKACVTSDFSAVEGVISAGGIVAFHDACEEDQGFGFQPHCGEPINVRAALKSLGLLDNSREGWESLGEVHGDKSKQGNGFAFFRKI